MDIKVLISLVESYAVLLVPLIIGVTEIIKRSVGIEGRWLSGIPLIIGILFALMIIGISGQSVVVGVILGLSASGLWSASKNFINQGNSGSAALKTLVLLLVISAVMLSFVGCNKNIVKPLETNKTIAEEILFEARILMNKGEITEQDFNLIKSIYEKLRDGQNVVIDARLGMLKYDTAEAEEKYRVAVAEIDRLLRELIQLAQKYHLLE